MDDSMEAQRELLVPALLFIASLVAIWPYYQSGGILASGECTFSINPDAMQFSSTWFDRWNFGNEQAGLNGFSLFNVVWWAISLFSPIANASIVYVFLSFFLSGLFMYYCLDAILKLREKMFYLPACLLYMFNIYRILGLLNPGVILLFVSMPLFFLFYYRMMNENRWRYIPLLVIVSFASNTMAGNLPVFLMPYVLIAAYFAFYMAFERNGRKLDLLIKNAVLLSLFFLVNLYWILPLLGSLFSIYSGLSTAWVWMMFTSGSFADHLRFMGYWGFRSGNYIVQYYPFNASYDSGVLLFTTFLVTVIALAGLLCKRRGDARMKVFFTAIAALSFVLISGIKPPFGPIYDFLYQNVSLFRIVRDPFMKFMPLFVFSICVLLAMSVGCILEKRRKITKAVVLTAISAMVLANSYPIFTTEAMPIRLWNAAQTGNIVQVPQYWSDAKVFVERDLLDSRMLVLPYNRYGSSNNWEYGVNVVENVANYLIDKPHIIGWESDISDSGRVTLPLATNMTDRTFAMERYAGFLNSNLALMENDIEWRFPKESNRIGTPAGNNRALRMQGYREVAKFGNFTEEALSRIPNDEPYLKVHDALYSELANAPALVLYSLDESYYYPHFYSPRQTIVLNASLDSAKDIVAGYAGAEPFAFYLAGQNQGKSLRTGLNAGGKAVLEYSKISETEYRLRIHSLPAGGTALPIVFSETFDPNWKAYLSRPQKAGATADGALVGKYRIFEGNEYSQATPAELGEYLAAGWVSHLGDGTRKSRQYQGWGRDREVWNRTEEYYVDFVSKDVKGTIQNNNLPAGNPLETWNSPALDEGKHLKANGFANSWVLDAADICQQKGADGRPDGTENGYCTKNGDGTYELELVVQFVPQKIAFVLQVLACAILLACGASLAASVLGDKKVKRQRA
jgi:hypothetical protein